MSNHFFMILILVSPFILFFGLLLILRYKISWRNLLALIIFFSAYPLYAFTGKPYLIIIPVVGFFALIAKDWTPKR